jgi:hypothetical protein
MIRQVTIKRFKQFASLDVKLPGHVVFAGPNNGGKTTFLQAIAAWDLAYRRWREMHDTGKRGGVYAFCPIARPDFLAVPLPLNSLDMLWTDRDRAREIEVHVAGDGWSVGMEFRFDEEQIRVRPVAATATDVFDRVDCRVAYAPPMGGLATEEPLYGADDFIAGRFAEGRPGEVLRNLLWRASKDHDAWSCITGAMRDLFGAEIDPPQSGKLLRVTYRMGTGVPLDLVCAGSGFQQVLMLVTVLALRPSTVLLVDEPDAHLHVILQDAIFHRLHDIAKRQHAQLIVATHSEVIVDSVGLDELLVMPTARPLADEAARSNLVRGLSMCSNTDLMLAKAAPGILYVEGHTDLALLRAWAAVLGHPAFHVLDKQTFWHAYSIQTRPDAPGFAARDHFRALQLLVPGLRGLEIQDRDGNPNLPETAVTGSGLQLIRWRRYEVESYLVHPTALERFLASETVPASPGLTGTNVRAEMEKWFGAAFVADPSKRSEPAEAVLDLRKARTQLLPPILAAGGLPGFPYTRFHEIAAQMLPSEIHPEVKEKLDAICTAFGIPLPPPPAVEGRS